MVKMLIDTCVWLDIAKDGDREHNLDVLTEFIDAGVVGLIIPELIITEFNRNKNKIITDAGKRIPRHFKTVRENVLIHGKIDLTETMIAQLNDIEYKMSVFSEKANITIQTIEELFKNSEIITSTDEIKLNAINRGIDKKAPFHLSKNSTNDAIILETFCDYKLKNESHEFYFITHNKNDFSLKEGNQKIPHEDLVNIFDSTKSCYFINLIEALKSINIELFEDIVNNNELFFNQGFEPRELSEIKAIECELNDKIWYNRHQNLVYDIKKGKTTICPVIYERARKAAKIIEETYGKENLYWDDFEWGVINGKLSAIRWVLGDEWDSLHT